MLEDVPHLEGLGVDRLSNLHELLESRALGRRVEQEGGPAPGPTTIFSGLLPPGFSNVVLLTG